MSDELIYEMVAAGAAAILPASRKAYDEVAGEVAVLGKLLALVDGVEPVPPTTKRGAELLDRLTQPVLLDIAVAIVRAIEDATHGTDRFVATPKTLGVVPIDRVRLATRMGLERTDLDLVVAAMTERIAALAETRDVQFTVDDRTITLARPPQVADDQRTAVAALEKMVQQAPTNVFIGEPLAALYEACGRVEEAVTMYASLANAASARDERATAARLCQCRGFVLERIGNASGALAAFEDAYQADPTNVNTMVKIGELCVVERRFSRARDMFRCIVELDSAAVDAYAKLGKVHVELGEIAEARAVVEDGLSVAPKSDALRALQIRLWTEE